jgi:5-methylcytosine-specific restriction endonuclease McrA
MESDRASLRLAHPAGSPDAGPTLVVPASGLHAHRALPARLDAVRLLSLDAHGRVLDWMSWQDATCLYARGAVAWTLGDPCLQVHGGICRTTGAQSIVELHPIVAARGHPRPHALDPTPALTNAALFARDQHLCLYCGREFGRHHLTRDHVVPLSQGGRDKWENVVAACFHCNSRKGGRTPQQANMPLLAVPYRPSWIEHLILANRNILADQMAFLRAQLPKRAPRFGDARAADTRGAAA